MKFPSKLKQEGNTLYLCEEDHTHHGEGVCWISFPGYAALAAEIAKRWLIAGLTQTEEIHVPKKGWVRRLRDSGYDDDDIIAIGNALIAEGANVVDDEIVRLEDWLRVSDEALLHLEEGDPTTARSLLSRISKERTDHGWDPLAYPVRIKLLKARVAELEEALKVKVERDLALYGNAVTVRKSQDAHTDNEGDEDAQRLLAATAAGMCGGCLTRPCICPDKESQ